MPSSPSNASRAYASTRLETTIADASPEQLILMLHDGLLESLHRARISMVEGAIAAKGESISRALAILTEGLMPTLDRERGGDIAANLGALYEYMITRLMMANLQNDSAQLDEVAKLVGELKSAWEQLSARSGHLRSPALSVDAAMDGGGAGRGASLSLGAA